MRLNVWEKHKGGGLPCSTISELAKELGLKEKQLGSLMQHDEAAPKPKFFGNERGGHNVVNWYVRRDVLRWWKAKQK